jgi:uroporphyrinogen-III synthase
MMLAQQAVPEQAVPEQSAQALPLSSAPEPAVSGQAGRTTARTVVITRPLAQAGALAARVRALGQEPVLLPLLDIVPLADPAPLIAKMAEVVQAAQMTQATGQARYAMVAFVSPNAIDAALAACRSLPGWTGWPQGVALAIMGEGSRACLAGHGIDASNATIFAPQDPQRTDSSTLLAALDLAQLAGRTVLLVRGDGGRELLADGLRAAGVKVEQITAYQRAAPPFDSARQTQLLDLLHTESRWIITSSEALRNLLHWVQQLHDPDAVVKMQRQQLLVPHARIAESAQALGFKHITLTGSGDEALLLALQSNS